MKKALSQYNTVAGTTPAYTQAVPASAHKYAELSMLGGKTVGWNQLVQNGNFADGTTGWSVYSGTGSVSNNLLTVTGATGRDGVKYSRALYVEEGHKYYVAFSISCTVRIEVFVAPSISRLYRDATQSLVNEENIVTASSRSYVALDFFPSNTGEQGNFTIGNIRIIDLTLLGMSDITSLTDPRIAQIKAYAAAHPEYNAGALVSAKVDEVKSVGANVWDEEWELGHWDLNTGIKVENATAGRCKNLIKVFPSTNYCYTCASNNIIRFGFFDSSMNYLGIGSAIGAEKTEASFVFTTPSNAYYMVFYNSQTTYNHDIQICLNTYAEKTTYHPYTASSLPIPTAVQNLDGYGQSAGTVYNYVDLEPVKYSNMKSVDLGTLTWTYWSADGEWYTDGLSGIAVEPVSASIPLNAICTTYPISSYSGKYTGAMYLLSGRLYCKNYSSTTSPTGILHYEATSGGSDYEAKLYHKRVGSVDLGSLTWNYHSATQSFYTIISDGEKYGASGYTNGKSVCSKYSSSRTDPMTDKTVAVGTYFGDSSNAWCVIKDTSYSDAAAFKTAMSGVYLFYELASEQILDVTDLVNDYALLNIYDSGTVTFHQQGGTEMSVPNALYFATAQRTNGTTFGDANSVDDLALIQQSVSVQPALPKTNLIEIPGADGYIDLTEALGVGIKYNAREIVWQFALPPAAVWHEKQSEVSNAINGKRCRITLDNDPEWYYEGRITVEKYESDKLLHRISVVATCNPYKISKISGGRSL